MLTYLYHAISWKQKLKLPGRGFPVNHMTAPIKNTIKVTAGHFTFFLSVFVLFVTYTDFHYIIIIYTHAYMYTTSLLFHMYCI